tara:strand:- start:830 stop:1207 length:378 start_codon:yes stop_codon:yes gene_type:complete
MTTLRETVRAVIDRWDSSEYAASDLFEELRAALEQQAEPVAWMFQHEETGRIMCVEAQQVEGGFEKGNPRLKKIAPLYTTPPQRKPLTINEVEQILAQHNYEIHGDRARYIVRMTEEAHDIKEAP